MSNKLYEREEFELRCNISKVYARYCLSVLQNAEVWLINDAVKPMISLLYKLQCCLNNGYTRNDLKWYLSPIYEAMVAAHGEDKCAMPTLDEMIKEWVSERDDLDKRGQDSTKHDDLSPDEFEKCLIVWCHIQDRVHQMEYDNIHG